MNAEAAPLTAARKRRARWAWVAIAGLIAIVAAIVGVTLMKPKTSATSDASTVAVERKTLTVVVSGTGSTVVADSVSVSPEISGTVEELYVSLGETVTAGQDLYAISSTDVEAQLLEAKASLLRAKQSKTQAEQNKQQATTQLYSAGTSQIQAENNLDKLQSQPATTPGLAGDIRVAQRQVASAKAGVSQAQTSLNAAKIGVLVAQANLDSAQQSYDDAVQATRDTMVSAPIGGVVTELPVSVGSQVNAGTTSSGGSGSSGNSGSSSTGGATTAASTSSSSGSSSAITISDMSALRVQVSVSEVDIPSLSAGQKAEVTFDALPDKTFSGTVNVISPNGTSSSGVVSYDVDIALDAQDPRLRPDMTATADVKTQVAENVLVVPNSAVKTSGGATYVEVVGQDGRLTRQTVTVGVSDETHTEVRSGLNEGAVVSTASSASNSSSSASRNVRQGGGFIMGGPPGGPGGN